MVVVGGWVLSFLKNQKLWAEELAKCSQLQIGFYMLFVYSQPRVSSACRNVYSPQLTDEFIKSKAYAFYFL